MATSLLLRVKSALFVHAHRRSRSLLEGEYASVFHGRSLDYDDLRDYAPGDEVRDIDWKATARHTSPLVRRHVASRNQHLLIVADTGRGMAATTSSGEVKKDVAIMAAGLLGYLAHRHGDVIGLVLGTADGTTAHDARGSESHLELLLRAIDGATRLDGQRSDLATQLKWIIRHVRRRMVLLVLADDRELDNHLCELLRRLHAQHEILWITVADADPTRIDGDRDAWDVADAAGLPTEVRLQPQVRQAYAAVIERRVRQGEELLSHLGLAHVRIGSSEEVVPGVLRLLERQRRAR